MHIRNCRPGHFAQLMGYCDHQMHKLLDAELRPYDISPVQCRTLVYLHEATGEVNQRMLERFLMVKPSTVNGIVCRLEEKGFLHRHSAVSDARCRILTLTAQGNRFFDDLCSIVKENTARMERGFTAEELETLQALLHRVAENLSSSEEESPLC